jgi:hypothetical protein
MALFLTGRSMLVEADGVRSTPRPIKSGVLQSLILSPLLFFLADKWGNLTGLAIRVKSELSVLHKWYPSHSKEISGWGVGQ